ncbi:MAG: hypothetical protein SOY27_09465 [Fournierella sp.]|uniref:hypothetical protein n=1 Tax=Allofournierella sp. TaxID=1940256 RepID=UPI0025C7033D|nr:hypothetical protein [Fournierella sp.]MDY4167696.1 hypothetical protein [Fournierella sp.]
MIWVIKLSGAVLVGTAGFLFGAEQAAVLRRRAVFWSELAGMLTQIQDAVRYRALATPCLLEELQAGEYPHLMLDNCFALEAYQFPTYISPGDAAPFGPLFGQIGQVSAQELCGQMPYYIELARQNGDRQEKEYKAAARLYPQAGVCAGLMAALLLL